MTLVFFSKENPRFKLLITLYFISLILLHIFLDSMTKGIGVAVLYPFSKELMNFPWAPLLPAGFSVGEFSQGMIILREALFVWLPSSIVILLSVKSKIFNKKD